MTTPKRKPKKTPKRPAPPSAPRPTFLDAMITKTQTVAEEPRR